MTAHYIEALNEYHSQPGEHSLFLAGGVTACPDWQSWMVDRLAGSGLVLLNPRRANFPINDPTAAPAQVAWEHQHLRLATLILFWFCAETLNPITLYELGAWSMSAKPIFIGTHPDYARRIDVELQTRWARPEVRVVHTLEALAQQVEVWSAQTKGGPLS